MIGVISRSGCDCAPPRIKCTGPIGRLAESPRPDCASARSSACAACSPASGVGSAFPATRHRTRCAAGRQAVGFCPLASGCSGGSRCGCGGCWAFPDHSLVQFSDALVGPHAPLSGCARPPKPKKKGPSGAFFLGSVSPAGGRTSAGLAAPWLPGRPARGLGRSARCRSERHRRLL